MTARSSRPVPQVNYGLLPAHYDQWGIDTERILEDFTSERRVHFMSWHPHVVAEGYVDADDYNLKRALRDENIIQ